MDVYRNIDEVGAMGEKCRAVAIGTFDGVHRGHQLIIQEAVREARSMDGLSMVVTFEPHPDSVVHAGRAPLILTPLSLKLQFLEGLGVDEVLVVPFDRSFSELTGKEFCELVLSERLRARQVVVGENFRFGRGGASTPEDLMLYGKEHGFSVTAVRLLECLGGAVSSTRLRELLLAGAVEDAQVLLGRPYMLQGVVVTGVGRGRSLGKPTANLEPEAGVVVPALGVYVTRTTVGDRLPQESVTSVGTNPTFEKDDVVRIETFLLDFSGSIYNEPITLAFLRRLRGQVAFPSAEALVAQIQKDVAAAHEYFAGVAAVDRQS